MPSGFLAYALHCCTFPSVEHTAFSLPFSEHSLHFFNSSHSFPLTTPYPLSSITWWPFFPQSSHVKYETTTFPLLRPNSNKSTSFSTPSPQYLNALCRRAFSELLLYAFCCTFCGITTYAAFSLSNLLFGQSLYQCPTPSYSKHFISFFCAFLLIEHAGFFFGCTFGGAAICTTLPLLSSSCLLISTPYLITLLDNASNLFWGTNILFFPSLLFLQLQARYPNFLYSKHIFPCLPSNSVLYLAKAHFSLSKLLINESYWVWDILLTYQWYGINIWSH